MKKVLLVLLFLFISLIAEPDSLIVTGVVKDMVLKENYLGMVAGLAQKIGPFISIVNVDNIDSQKVVVLLDKDSWEELKTIVSKTDKSFQETQENYQELADSVLIIGSVEDRIRGENVFLVIGIWFEKEFEKKVGVKGPYITIVSVNKIDAQKVTIVLDKDRWEEFKKTINKTEETFRDIQKKTKGFKRGITEEEATGIAGGFFYKNVHFKDSGVGYIKVIGEMTNNSGKDYLLAHFRISVYDEDDNLLESELIIISNFSNGQTKTFEGYIYTDYDLSQMSKYKIEFDSGIEEE